MNRRGFLQGILTAGMAPAFIGSSILMPVRTLWKPETHSWSATLERGMWIITNSGLVEMTVSGFEVHDEALRISYETVVPGEGAIILPGESRVFYGPSKSGMDKTARISKIRLEA